MIQLIRSLFLSLIIIPSMTGQEKSIKIGVAGLSHTHVHWIFNSEPTEDFNIVGIVEPNRELAQRYADQYQFPMTKVFNTLEELIAVTQPDAVTAFGTIYDHLDIVETCAPKGIHVMVEKPLAVNLVHAQKMKGLADQHKIHLLTNYETTWYPTNHKAYDIIKEQSTIGALRKIVVRDGHRGPKKIGVDPEFLDWLTDPILNGGGAVTDFGCYGANLLTWFMEGQRPKTVTAITLQQQSENNPNVDDEAIILLTYPNNVVGVIQASWNWPIGRKDMEVYGLKGALFADNKHDLRIRIAEGYDGYNEEIVSLPDRDAPYHDPFAFFIAVLKDEISVHPNDLSALENNMIVMEILDAAIRSANSGQTIELN